MGNEDFWTVSFAKEAELLEAVRRLRDAGHEIADVYTPYPIHGLDELLELRPSRLGWVTFGAGAFGGLSAFAFQAWSSSASWPLNVGGKPNVSTLAFIPITFEVTVLCAGLATAAAFLLKSRLYPRPRPAVAERITDDRFALVLDPLAGSLGESELRRLFAEAGADSVVASGGGEPGRAGLKPRARRQSPARGLGARFSGLRLLARGFSPVRKRGQRRASDLSLLLLALLASGCFWSSEKPAWEYLPDMRNSVPYDAFASNPVFRDGKTLQRPAPGTVPRGFLPFPYGPEPEEAERAGRELENPFPASPEVLVRGEHLYRTFCLVCHGETGTGDGPLIPKIAPPPAYDSESVRSHPPGRLFHVVTWGTGRMPSYRAQISQDDRWRLVHWVRKLQTSPPQTEEIAP